MSNRPHRLFTIAAMISLAACSQQSQPPAAIAPAPKALPVANESLGVPECDDYLNKYEACVMSRAPEAARGALVKSLSQTRNAWRGSLSTPAGKEALAKACQQARDTARPSLAGYGCTDF